MLLWIGAVLCFIAYSIQVASMDDAPGDNVSSYCKEALHALHQILTTLITPDVPGHCFDGRSGNNRMFLVLPRS